MLGNKAGEEGLVVVEAEGAEGEGGAVELVVEVMVVVGEDEDEVVVVGQGQPACEASRPWIDSWRSMPVDQETPPRCMH